jgi:2-amino-4-hydroxy-6-hydroxymethyldihydropteridine diphosphokinase
MFALGANLGTPLEALAKAGAGLAEVLGGPEASGVYRTPPEGGADQPSYLNAVVRGSGSLGARDALRLAGRLEREAGRVRTGPGAARVLDVDVLFVGDDVVDEPGLHVPHERWATRDFVVVPLLDIAPDWRDPRSGRTVAEVADAAGWAQGRFPVVLPPGDLLALEMR